MNLLAAFLKCDRNITVNVCEHCTDNTDNTDNTDKQTNVVTCAAVGSFAGLETQQKKICLIGRVVSSYILAQIERNVGSLRSDPKSAVSIQIIV